MTSFLLGPRFASIPDERFDCFRCFGPGLQKGEDLRTDLADSDLVEFIEKNCNRPDVIIGFPKSIKQEWQQSLIAEPEAIRSEIEFLENTLRSRDDFDLISGRDSADHIDVTLAKLTEAPFLRAIGAPDRPDVVAPEYLGDFSLVSRYKTGERHREIVAKTVVCQFAVFRLSQLLAPLQDLEQRSEEHTSELQSLAYLVCRLLLEKKKTNTTNHNLMKSSEYSP